MKDDIAAGVYRRTGRTVRRTFGHATIRQALLGALALLALSCIASTAWLTWRENELLGQRVSAEAAARMRTEISAEIMRLLDGADLVNESIRLALGGGRVSGGDEEAVRRLLLDSSRLVDEGKVAAIRFGARSGHHVGIKASHDDGSSVRWRFTGTPAGMNARPFVTVAGGQDDRIDAALFVPDVRDARLFAWYRLAALRSGPAWSRAENGPDGNGPTIVRSVALRDENSGALLGVVAVELLLEPVRRSLGGFGSGGAFLADADGTLLGQYRPCSGRPDSGQTSEADISRESLVSRSSAPFSRAMSEYVSTRFGGFGRVGADAREHLTLDGEPGHLLVSPVGRDAGLDWTLALFVPVRDHLAPLPSRLSRLAIPALLATLIGSAALWLIGVLVARPLTRLRRGVERIAVGEFDVSIDTDGSDEVGDLARSLDHMRVQLRSSFDTLVEQRLIAEVTLESIADGVVTIDAAGKVRYMNAVAERLTGTELDEARDKSIESVFQARDERTGLPMTRGLMLRSLADAHAIGQPVVVTSASGSTHLVHCRVTPVTDEEGRGHGGVLNFSDLSEELRLKSELVHRATHDPLTDLVNRREFERRTTLALDNSRRRGSIHTLCYVDLDRFKLVNDSAGHEAGDELLRQIARLLDESVRGGDTVARLGGDEFGILLEHCTLERAERVMDNLRKRVEAFRFHWNGRGYSVGLSAGLVAVSEVSVSAIAVMRDADSACYIAKGGGRGRLHVHREDDEELVRLRDDHSWIERIEQALEHDRFKLRAQRIESADVDDKGHRHVEILLRLLGDDGEELSPAEFLPAAERYSLASRLDRWVVSHAIDWLVSNSPGGDVPDLCSINLSGQSLGEPAMLPFIVSEIRRSGVSPSVICFEVTETATIANLSNALELIATLRELGCSFALDDFGSGLSSFAYLKTLPVNYLKIDGVFVRDMLEDPLDLAMVRSINEVGQTMGMRTVAEYVENDALRQALRELGVDYVQGYGVGRPESLDALAFAPIPERVAEGDPV